MGQEKNFDSLVEELLSQISGGNAGSIPTGISNRHIHLCQAHFEILFGKDCHLQQLKPLGQPGQYAAKETVCVAGRKDSFSNVRVLGPLRKESQLEISRSDAYALGIDPPVRLSGDLKGSAGICVIGPVGMLLLEQGVIIAKRHIHMTPDDARRFGVADGDVVAVQGEGERACLFRNVVVRATVDSALEFHVDTDEANAADLRSGMKVSIVSK